MSDKLTVEDLGTIRHESAHVVAGYLLLGAKSVKSVTRVPRGNLIGCASFDVPEFTDPDAIPLAAMDYAVVLSIPQLTPGAAKGHRLDIERADECQAIAYRYAGKTDDVGEWREAWDYRKWKRVEELLDSTMFWKSVKALELRLDNWPTLSGEVVRVTLAKVLATT